MEISNNQRAKVLSEALPYIQKYYNKIDTAKYGGNAMIDEDTRQSVMGDVVLFTRMGTK